MVFARRRTTSYIATPAATLSDNPRRSSPGTSTPTRKPRGSAKSHDRLLARGVALALGRRLISRDYESAALQDTNRRDIVPRHVRDQRAGCDLLQQQRQGLCGDPATPVRLRDPVAHHVDAVHSKAADLADHFVVREYGPRDTAPVFQDLGPMRSKRLAFARLHRRHPVRLGVQLVLEQRGYVVRFHGPQPNADGRAIVCIAWHALMIPNDEL